MPGHASLGAQPRERAIRSACSAGVEATTVNRTVETLALYGPKGARALLNGALEIAIRPEKGWPNWSMRKIADAAESAQTNSAAAIVRFGRAKRPKLTKITVSQNTSTATNGFGIAVLDCAKRTRVCAKSIPYQRTDRLGHWLRKVRPLLRQNPVHAKFVRLAS